MSAKDRGRLETLSIADIRIHPTFQLRVNGLDTAHVGKLERVLKAGEDLPALNVAKVGKAFYLVGGHHRLEAHRRAGKSYVLANVTQMSLAEAQAAALRENTDHGKAMSRADRRAHWERYVAEGRHLNADGTVKGSTTISRELGHMYSRPTILKNLKSLGIELDLEGEYPHGYKPYRTEEDEDGADELAQERLAVALEALERFRAEYVSLEQQDQQALRGTARRLLEAMERGERPAAISTGPLDI